MQFNQTILQVSTNVKWTTNDYVLPIPPTNTLLTKFLCLFLYNLCVLVSSQVSCRLNVTHNRAIFCVSSCMSYEFAWMWKWRSDGAWLNWLLSTNSLAALYHLFRLAITEVSYLETCVGPFAFFRWTRVLECPVVTLHRILPIHSCCRKIRMDDQVKGCVWKTNPKIVRWYQHQKQRTYARTTWRMCIWNCSRIFSPPCPSKKCQRTHTGLHVTDFCYRQSDEKVQRSQWGSWE